MAPVDDNSQQSVSDGENSVVTSRVKVDSAAPSTQAVVGSTDPDHPSDHTNSRTGGDSRYARLDEMRGAVKTLLECIGENPDREGLLNTPTRYAKALLFLTKRYNVNLENLVGTALQRAAQRNRHCKEHRNRASL